MMNGEKRDDLIQMGLLSLTKASERYDARTGNKFNTYARWWLMQ